MIRLRSERGEDRAANAAAARGFTLIELMIVVAIVAVLAAIAVPAYLDSVWKGKRAEAKAAIMRALQSEERYYTQNNSYVEYPGGGPAPSSAFPVFSGDNLANSHYTIAAFAGANPPGTCTAGSASRCVTIIATLIGQADPKCGTSVSMDTTGKKSSQILDAVCWK